MRVVINGNEQEIGAARTIAELLVALKLPGKGIAVELNGRVIPGEEHQASSLAPDDRIEIVSLAGGG